MGERCYVGYVACQATTSYAVFENTSFRAPYYFYQGNLDQADQYIDTLSDAVYDPRLRFPVALQEADKNIARIMAYSVYLVSKYKQVFVKLGILPKRPQLSKEALWQHTIGLYQKCVAYALQAPPSDQAQTKHDCDTATQGFINALKTTTFFGASASN